MKIYDYAGKKNISGERIREARTRLHLTQTNLAVQLKLSGVDVERDSISVLKSERVLLLITKFVSYQKF